MSADLRIVLLGASGDGQLELLAVLNSIVITPPSELDGQLTVIGSSTIPASGKSIPKVLNHTFHYAPPTGPTLSIELSDCPVPAVADTLAKDAGQTLGQTIWSADVLTISLDISLEVEPYQQSLSQLRRTIQAIRRERGRRLAVAGWPVVVWLQQSERLDDSTRRSRLAEVQDRLKDLAHSDGFGSLACHVLQSSSLEPSSVTEWLHRCRVLAQEYRDQQARASASLWQTVLATVVGLLAMLMLAGLLVTARPANQPSALAGKIEAFRAHEGQTPSSRLRGDPANRVSVLRELSSDPDFERLPSELQSYIRQRLREYEEYREYWFRLLRLRPPSECRSEVDLFEVERRLREDFNPPAEFAAAWEQTEAAQLRRRWLTDASAIRNSANMLMGWLMARQKETEGFLVRGETWSAWRASLRKRLAESESLPVRPEDLLPDSYPLILSSRRVEPVTYASVLSLRNVESLRQTWEKSRTRLSRLADVISALGLADESAPDQAPLRVPEMRSASLDARLADLRERRMGLERSFSRLADTSLADCPQSEQKEIRKSAEESYTHLLNLGRQMLARQLAGNDTPAGWLATVDGLRGRAEWRDWQLLERELRRWFSPAADDPLAVYEEFVRRPQFIIPIRAVQVRIPDELRDQRFRPADNFKITIRGGMSMSFRLEHEERDARTRTTNLTFVTSDTPLVYKPGESLVGELLVRDASNRLGALSWSRSRWQTFGFESLTQPASLRIGEEKASEATGVSLSIVTPAAWPTIPTLLPNKPRE